VCSSDLARLALTVLEKGASGILVKTDKPSVLRETLSVVRKIGESFKMEEAVVTSIKPLGLGDRVCVDMAIMLDKGEGLLVGDSSSFLFLVHGETMENPYADPRPFRVNAGGVHAYTRVPGGKTRYLAELKSGDTVLVVSPKGKSREAVVGRVKIERRPLLLVTAEILSSSGKDSLTGSLILQNAETIRLVSPSGEAISVVELKKGDPVLAAVDMPGRHFGVAVEETILEK
jgi:3-dehydroquinate synthase II